MSEKLRAELVVLLAGMEQELRLLGVWENVAPAPDRLASEVPFCHDTLEFTQWMQWVFIPRFRAVLEGGHPLPGDCSIAPIAEDAFAELAGDTDTLLAQLRSVDRLLTAHGRRA